MRSRRASPAPRHSSTKRPKRRRSRRREGYTSAGRPSVLISSDIQIPNVERVLFDEQPARLDLVAQEDRENLVGLGGVGKVHLEHLALVGIHRDRKSTRLNS